jgi:AcrR family transcriptional regulator
MKSGRGSGAPRRRYSQVARAEAAEATARRIVEAFLARLMSQWFDEITLDQVAADADVTVQTVVRRFGGKDGLLARAVEVLSPRIHAQRAGPPGDIASLVDRLLADYEETGDAVVRLLALAPRHPAVERVVEFGRGQHREWVTDAFGEPLRRLATEARRRAIDALVVVTDVYTWRLLRRDMARSVPATAETMRRLITATIAEFIP